jgi:hypothetical protein
MTLDNELGSIWTVFLNYSLFKCVTSNLEIMKWYNELERMWKEVIMAEFEVLTHQFCKGMRKSLASQSLREQAFKLQNRKFVSIGKLGDKIVQIILY